MTATAASSAPTPAAAAAAPVAAAPATPAAASAPAAASSIDIKGSIARARQSWDETTARTNNSALQAKVFWNTQIAAPTNQAIRVANVEFQKARNEFPGTIVAASTITVGAITAATGRGSFRTIRNTSFAALLSGLAVAPAATIGTLALLRDRIATAAGYSRPTTVVIQQPIVAPTNKQ